MKHLTLPALLCAAALLLTACAQPAASSVPASASSAAVSSEAETSSVPAPDSKPVLPSSAAPVPASSSAPVTVPSYEEYFSKERGIPEVHYDNEAHMWFQTHYVGGGNRYKRWRFDARFDADLYFLPDGKLENGKRIADYVTAFVYATSELAYAAVGYDIIQLDRSGNQTPFYRLEKPAEFIEVYDPYLMLFHDGTTLYRMWLPTKQVDPICPVENRFSDVLLISSTDFLIETITPDAAAFVLRTGQHPEEFDGEVWTYKIYSTITNKFYDISAADHESYMQDEAESAQGYMYRKLYIDRRNADEAAMKK